MPKAFIVETVALTGIRSGLRAEKGYFLVFDPFGQLSRPHFLGFRQGFRPYFDDLHDFRTLPRSVWVGERIDIG